MSAPTSNVKSSRYIGQEDLADATEAHLDEEQAPAPEHGQPRPRPYSSRTFASGRGGGRRAERPQRRAGQARQDPQPSEGHPQGVPEFPGPLPGYHHYRAPDPALPHQPLDVGPAEPYYSKGMAHGIAAPAIPHGGRPAPRPEERARLAATRKLTEHEIHPPAADPVPVTIVQQGGGARPLRRASLIQVTVPAPGGDPVILVTRNPHRKSVRLLNESAQPVRLTADLTLSGGALLPQSMTGYLQIDTQDDICAYVPASGSGAALISVITEYDVAGGT